ncbi:MAG: DUF4160 domain-containing protein [Planctomycetes bacterium]|nr:DUF4160 domain-containing protein [Planctomycetota bacterium]
MPEIARFYGIIIKMYYRDHAPPHFHAEYGEHELLITISPIGVFEGHAPPRVRSMVLEWCALHQAELADNWTRCRTGNKPVVVAPLE